MLLLLSLCLKRSVNKCVYLLRALTVEQKDDSGTVGENRHSAARAAKSNELNGHTLYLPYLQLAHTHTAS